MIEIKVIRNVILNNININQKLKEKKIPSEFFSVILFGNFFLEKFYWTSDQPPSIEISEGKLHSANALVALIKGSIYNLFQFGI